MGLGPKFAPLTEAHWMNEGPLMVGNVGWRFKRENAERVLIENFHATGSSGTLCPIVLAKARAKAKPKHLALRTFRQTFVARARESNEADNRLDFHVATQPLLC